MPSRRTVLAASTGLLAGRPRSPGGPAGRPASGSRTARPASDGTPDPMDDCTSGYLVTADPYDPAGGLPVDPGDAARSLVATAADEGAVEVTTYAGTPPVRSGVYVEHDGTYYRAAVDETATTRVPALTMNVDWE